MSVCLGQISYINTLPVTVPIVSGQVNFNSQFVYGTPAQLNSLLEQKKLDISAMSAYFFLQSNEFNFLPGLSISSQTRVGSVLFFSKEEITSLKHSSVLASQDSLTSIMLLRVLALELSGHDLTLVPARVACDIPNITDNSCAKADIDIASAIDDSNLTGILYIGDQAMLQDNELSKKFIRYDLGELWYKLTGLPMVFGLWGARKSWINTNKNLFSEIAEKLTLACELGLSTSFSQVLNEAHNKTKINYARLEHYYRKELDYSFGELQQKGLAKFKSLCKKHGFIVN